MFQQPVMPDVKQQERLSTSSDTCYNLHKSVPTSCDKFIQIFLTFKYHIRVLFLILVSHFTPQKQLFYFEIQHNQWKTAFKKYTPVCVQPWLNGRVSIPSVKKKLYVSDRSATAERKRKIMGCGRQTGPFGGVRMTWLEASMGLPPAHEHGQAPGAHRAQQGEQCKAEGGKGKVEWGEVGGISGGIAHQLGVGSSQGRQPIDDRR